jgi:hypothetical protein
MILKRSSASERSILSVLMKRTICFFSPLPRRLNACTTLDCGVRKRSRFWINFMRTSVSYPSSFSGVLSNKAASGTFFESFTVGMNVVISKRFPWAVAIYSSSICRSFVVN